jgi:hypothetical protein
MMLVLLHVAVASNAANDVLVPTFASAAAADDAMSKASGVYERLLVMVDSPDQMEPHTREYAIKHFAAAAKRWRNVTFRLVPYDPMSSVIRELVGSLKDGDEVRPCIGLIVQDFGGAHGALRRPIAYSAACDIPTTEGLSEWLYWQDAIKLGSLDKQATHLELEGLVKYAYNRRPHQTVVLALMADSSDKAELAFAVRSAGVQLPVRIGNRSVAQTLGVPAFPSVLVAHSTNGRLAATDTFRWPLWTPKRTDGGTSWAGLRHFLSESALPPLVPVGDSSPARDFMQQLRRSRLGLTIYLFHNRHGRWADRALTNEERLNVMRKSIEAIEVMTSVATTFAGKARFVSLDYFDNDPEQPMMLHVIEDFLPTAVAISARFDREEEEVEEAQKAGQARINQAARVGTLHADQGLLEEDTAQQYVEAIIQRHGTSPDRSDLGTFWTPRRRSRRTKAKEEL